MRSYRNDLVVDIFKNIAKNIIHIYLTFYAFECNVIVLGDFKEVEITFFN
jgi:hypothetical protein